MKEILDRELTRPAKRQEDAARALSEMEAHDTSQLKEVERRRADFAAGKERYATDQEVAALWKKCGL